jgi:hypothetical protein
MLSERDLFGFHNAANAHARRGDPDTSHAAAKEVTPHVRGVQKAVLAYAALCGWAGFTDLDLASHFQSQSSSYRSRRAELVDQGLIEDSGERRTVAGGTRRHAVWRITSSGEGEVVQLGLAPLARAA